MSLLLIVEQVLNGLQLGVMLFLMAAGLTLVFGIMGLINLAHGALYMVGAFVAASVAGATGSFLLAVVAAIGAAALLGVAIEIGAMRRLYEREHLDQVLATFGLILFLNEMAVILWGRQPQFMAVPSALSGTVEILPGAPYPVYRLVIIAVGLGVAAALAWLITRTRFGMLIRAGASDRAMVDALGIDVRWLYTAVFALGALLVGLAGALAGPVLSVEAGMGEEILVLTFVVIVVGGIGSIRGALLGAVLVGLVDTLSRAILPSLLRLALPPAQADGVGAGLASMSIYLFMALVLAWRPRGLVPAHG